MLERCEMCRCCSDFCHTWSLKMLSIGVGPVGKTCVLVLHIEITRHCTATSTSLTMAPSYFLVHFSYDNYIETSEGCGNSSLSLSSSSLVSIRITNSIAYEPEGSISHSRGLSSNPYPRLKQPNYLY